MSRESGSATGGVLFGRFLLLLALMFQAAAVAARELPAAPQLPFERLAESEYETRSRGAGLQAANRAHGFRARFESTGVLIEDRTAAGAPALVRFGAAEIGRANALRSLEAGKLVAAGRRTEIVRPELTEWFINGEEGLEHGLTLAERPPGSAQLRVVLAVSVARATDADGRAVFETPTGRKLDYGKLEVMDASGKELPSTLRVASARRIEIQVDDAGATYPIVIDPLLTESYDTRGWGGQTGASMGFSVADAGDVNGDGFGDVIIGARDFDAGFNSEGAAWIFVGSASGTVSSTPAAAWAEYLGASNFADFGTSVSGAGDVNGDGYDDVVVGAQGFIAGPSDRGAAFVFLGGPIGFDGTTATAFASIQPALGVSHLGVSVSGAGDVNGDGYADVVLGAPDFFSSATSDGAALVVLGAPSAPLAIHQTIVSHVNGAHFGTSVAGAGDVNGDGFADIAVGAPNFSGGQATEGAVFLFEGSASGIAATTSAAADDEIQADQIGALFGTSVAGAGDVNGDGYSDIISGSPFWDTASTDDGAAFIFHGSALGITASDAGDADTFLTASALVFQPAFGQSVASAGDVNGDGYSDVMVGSPEDQEGVARLYLGDAAGVDSEAYAVLLGEGAGDDFGHAVGGGADVDGDGYSDVLVGAPGFELVLFFNSGEGGWYLYQGGGTGIAHVSGLPDPGIHAIVSGDQAGAEFGTAASASGDLDGDGYGDVVVSAGLWDDTLVDEGAAFVFYGGGSGIGAMTPSSADLVLRSPSPVAGGMFGSDLAILGDVDGDGFDDLAIVEQSGPANEVYLFRGSGSGVSASPSTTISADSTSMIEVVAAGGDVNGDGYGDLLVGVPTYDAPSVDEGGAFVFHGGPAGIASGGIATADASIESDLAGGLLGTSLYGGADVDGDGYADVAVGAPGYVNGNFAEGIVLVFHGSGTGVSGGDTSDADWAMEGGSSVQVLGSSVGLADFNGDGYADLVAGGNELGEGPLEYVFLGSPAGLVGSSVPDAATAFDLGTRFVDEGPSGVYPVGDIDGDGYADLVIAGPSFGLSTVWLFLGGPTGFPPNGGSIAARIWTHEAPTDLLGTGVAAGDFNGDGFADLVLGAVEADPSGLTDAGETYVWLGGETLGRFLDLKQLDPVSATRRSPWAGAGTGGFDVQMEAWHPDGRGRVKLEVESCAAGSPFGSPACTTTISSSWTDTTAGSVLLTEFISASADTTYRWRARVLHAPTSVTEPGITPPFFPAHGPWRRVGAQRIEGDVRTVPEPGAATALAAGAALLQLLSRRRQRRGGAAAGLTRKPRLRAWWCRPVARGCR